ncbi:MAG: UDP-glucose/GDP-mannose dehydrogenase family protein [Patescibacteria group bacterium]
MKITVVGTGYVGLACTAFVRKGHEIVCVDIDANKIAMLERGEIPILEPGLSDLIADGRSSGLLSFTTNLAEALKGADVCFICVGTPPLPDGSADLRFVETAMGSVKALKESTTIVVIKSTVPVGTCARLGAVSNPEFLREGRAIEDFLHPDRIVIGTDDESAKKKLLELYASFDCPKLVMSPASSELTKYAANGFLATKISFINEIANLCDCVGANVLDVAQAIGLDSRIGPHFLHAGLGYGGSCFPKDTVALHQIAGSHDHDFRLLEAVISANKQQRARFVQKVFKRTSPGDVLAVWGLAFKAGTDDVRESAAIEIVHRLMQSGYKVRVFDPMAMEGAKKIVHDRDVFVSSALMAVNGVDALLVLTEWPEFRDVDFDEVRRSMKQPRIFDGRNLLADLALEKRGFEYVGVGLGQRV